MCLVARLHLVQLVLQVLQRHIWHLPSPILRLLSDHDGWTYSPRLRQHGKSLFITQFIILICYPSQFFGLFGLSNRASSMIGPNVIQAIINNTGNNWMGFPFLFALCTVASMVIWFGVDVQTGRRDALAWAKDIRDNQESREVETSRAWKYLLLSSSGIYDLTPLYSSSSGLPSALAGFAESFDRYFQQIFGRKPICIYFSIILCWHSRHLVRLIILGVLSSFAPSGTWLESL